MTHQMVLQEAHASGAQTWMCPTCGRRFVIQWPPQYSRIVLDAGDENIPHTGASGGLQMGGASVSQSEPAAPASHEDDPYLAPWSDWLDQMNL